MPSPADLGILTTDRDLVVQSWDDWLVAATSIAAAAARGRRIGELAPPLDEPRFAARLEETLATGAVQVLSPAFHRGVIPCPPRVPSGHFPQMQQRVTIGPLLDGSTIAGLLITLQDVTPQLDAERQLAADLASDNPETRRAAAEAVASARHIESLEHFAPVLGSDDWRVRADAVRGLAAAADRDLLRALLATLQREHRNFSTLSSALKMLALADADITQPLAELLQDPDADLRMQAALALGEQHRPGAAAALLHALEDPNPNVRFHAIEALGRLRAESAIEPLLGIVESRDFFLSFAALDALALMRDSRVAPQLAPLLADDDLREGVTHALSQLGDEAVARPLVAALNRTAAAAPSVVRALAAIADRLLAQGQDDREIAAAVRETLTDSGREHLLAAIPSASPDALPAFARVLGWLTGTDVVAALSRIAAMPAARAAAVDALTRQGEAAVDAFVAMVALEDPELRATAIAALGRLGNRRATPALTALLAEDPSTIIAASGALARLGDPAAFEPLLAHIGHPDQAVRQAVIGALNSIGHPDMAARVTGLLRDDDPLARESAVRIAGYFGYAGTLDLVIACAGDPAEPVRVAALEHLPFFDGDRALPVLSAALGRETPRGRAAAARALARVEGPEAVRLLAGALSDEDHWVRYYAARAIGEQVGSPGVPALATAADADAAVPVRIAALDAIGTRGDQEAGEVVLRCAADPEDEIAAAALRTVGRLGGPGALEVLRTNGRNGSLPRRLAAVEGLGAFGTADAVAQLEWIAAADPDPSIGHAAVAALRDIAASERAGAREAIDALLALCAAAERREAAGAALSSLPEPALPRVSAGLHHPDPAVRRRTVDVLAGFRRPEATRHLGAAFSDADAGVRETAAAAVLRLGTMAYDDVLQRLAQEDPSKAVRRAAGAVLAARRSGS